MNVYQRCCLLLVCTALFAASGASCPKTFLHQESLPRVLPPAPTVEQVMEVVNRNSSQITSFSTNRATLSGSDMPTSLRASIAFERPRRFRLRGETGITGAEFDLGSNDELFWFWVRRSQTPGMYFCRHDQFATSQARQMLPFEPTWLIEALGVAALDPALPHQGPQFLPNDRLRMDTIVDTPQGPVTKVMIIDGSQGWVLEQHVLDARRQLLASAVASGHRRDPLSGLVMPTVVQVRCPPANLSLKIDLGNVEINRPVGDPVALWSMPNYGNGPVVDMGNPNFRPPAPAAQAPANGRQPPPQTSWRRTARQPYQAQ
ncbi:MAG: hypothetical protein LLG00_01420 [Planctomycetaceae bacterium]|nr:hypothetical protein [Planctomycetaceae bacterium]